MTSPVSTEVRDTYLAMPWPIRARHIARYPSDFGLLEDEEDRHQVLLRHGSDLLYARLRSLRPEVLARTLAEHPALLDQVGSVTRRRELLSVLARPAKTVEVPAKRSLADELVCGLAWALAAATGTSLPLYLLLKALSHA